MATHTVLFTSFTIKFKKTSSVSKMWKKKSSFLTVLWSRFHDDWVKFVGDEAEQQFLLIFLIIIFKSQMYCIKNILQGFKRKTIFIMLRLSRVMSSFSNEFLVLVIRSFRVLSVLVLHSHMKFDSNISHCCQDMLSLLFWWLCCQIYLHVMVKPFLISKEIRQTRFVQVGLTVLQSKFHDNWTKVVGEEWGLLWSHIYLILRFECLMWPIIL